MIASSIRAVRDLSTFETFLRMCAGRCGQLVNLTGLASDCGITHGTARAWLSVLEASYLIHLLPPHFKSFSKRLIKSPKLYFLDPGLAAWLLGIRGPEQLAIHPMRGALFESWICAELLKGFHNRARRPSLYFWRDRSGLEIDFIVDHGTHLIAVEAKSGATFVGEWIGALTRWRELATDSAGSTWVVYGGREGPGTLRGTQMLPWQHMEQLVTAAVGPDAAT